ncbi:hypothetical protein CBL_07255 [Carabus blaptoides fortunei]
MSFGQRPTDCAFFWGSVLMFCCHINCVSGNYRGLLSNRSPNESFSRLSRSTFAETKGITCCFAKRADDVIQAEPSQAGRMQASNNRVKLGKRSVQRIVEYGKNRAVSHWTTVETRNLSSRLPEAGVLIENLNYATRDVSVPTRRIDGWKVDSQEAARLVHHVFYIGYHGKLKKKDTRLNLNVEKLGEKEQRTSKYARATDDPRQVK